MMGDRLHSGRGESTWFERVLRVWRSQTDAKHGHKNCATICRMHDNS